MPCADREKDDLTGKDGSRNAGFGIPSEALHVGNSFEKKEDCCRPANLMAPYFVKVRNILCGRMLIDAPCHSSAGRPREIRPLSGVPKAEASWGLSRRDFTNPQGEPEPVPRINL
jgi:hypothetical protein